MGHKYYYKVDHIVGVQCKLCYESNLKKKRRKKNQLCEHNLICINYQIITKIQVKKEKSHKNTEKKRKIMFPVNV